MSHEPLNPFADLDRQTLAERDATITQLHAELEQAHEATREASIAPTALALEWRIKCERAEARAERAEHERDLGHTRMDECSYMPSRDGLPLYERISWLIERIGGERNAAVSRAVAVEHEKAALQESLLAEANRRCAVEIDEQVTKQALAAKTAECERVEQERDAAYERIDKVIGPSLEIREFQIMDLCGILDLSAEELLEPTIRGLRQQIQTATEALEQSYFEGFHAGCEYELDINQEYGPAPASVQVVAEKYGGSTTPPDREARARKVALKAVDALGVAVRRSEHERLVKVIRAALDAEAAQAEQQRLVAEADRQSTREANACLVAENRELRALLARAGEALTLYREATDATGTAVCGECAEIMGITAHSRTTPYVCPNCLADAVLADLAALDLKR